MSFVDLCLIRSSSVSDAGGLRLGEPQLDAYLEFVAARCRPNTVLAVAFDLKVFFAVVGKPPGEVSTADVLGFVTAQRAGRGTATAVAVVDGRPGGVSARTVRRRLSSVSGLFAFLLAAATSPPIRSRAGCRRVGSAAAHGRVSRWCVRRARCRRCCRRLRWTR